MCCPQVYIGHSEPVQAVAFTPDQQQLLSVGDAIFFWDILAFPERSSSGRQVPPLDQNLLGLLLHLLGQWLVVNFSQLLRTPSPKQHYRVPIHSGIGILWLAS